MKDNRGACKHLGGEQRESGEIQEGGELEKDQKTSTGQRKAISVKKKNLLYGGGDFSQGHRFILGVAGKRERFEREFIQ